MQAHHELLAFSGPAIRRRSRCRMTVTRPAIPAQSKAWWWRPPSVQAPVRPPLKSDASSPPERTRRTHPHSPRRVRDRAVVRSTCANSASDIRRATPADRAAPATARAPAAPGDPVGRTSAADTRRRQCRGPSHSHRALADPTVAACRVCRWTRSMSWPSQLRIVADPDRSPWRPCAHAPRHPLGFVHHVPGEDRRRVTKAFEHRRYHARGESISLTQRCEATRHGLRAARH